MSKVDWITWKTNPNEIINPEKVMANIEDYINNYICYMNAAVYNEIGVELTTGGLSSKSLIINGEEKAHTQAKEILNKIDTMKENLNKLKDKFQIDVLNQKEIEKKQLIEAISEKLIEEEKKLNNTLSLREKVSPDNEMINISELDDVIYLTNERINRLKEKLDIAYKI